MQEYLTLYNEYPVRGQCRWITPWSVNTGLFSAIIEQPTVSWVSVGHNHDSDFYGNYLGIYLAYGRKSGHGGWTCKNLLNGARIFEVDEETGKIETWIRQSDGSIER